MNNSLSDQDIATVNAILAEELGVTLDQIKPEAHLYRDLGADSLTVIEVGMNLEDRFNLAMPDESLENLETVADVYDALASALSTLGHR